MDFEIRIVHFQGGFDCFSNNVFWFVAGGNKYINWEINISFRGYNSFLLPDCVGVPKRLPDVIDFTKKERSVEKPGSGMAKIEPPAQIKKRYANPEENQPATNTNCRKGCWVRKTLGRFPSAFLLFQGFHFHNAKRFGNFFA